MSKATMRTRKPVHEMTVSDFEAFPVWEYVSDEESEGQDETWVRPVNTDIVPMTSYSLVAAKFITANKREFMGFITVSTLTGDPEIYQGVILHQNDFIFVSNAEA